MARQIAHRSLSIPSLSTSFPGVTRITYTSPTFPTYIDTWPTKKDGEEDIWFNYRTIDKDETDPTIAGPTKTDITSLRYIFGHFTGDEPTGSTLVANYFTGTAADTSGLVATHPAGTTGYYIVVDPDHRALHTDPNTIYFI